MRKAIVFIVVALLLVLFAVPAYAQEEPPKVPHAFYGNVAIDSSPAPAGTRVEARGTGVLIGVAGNPLTITQAGKYGGAGALDPKLVVQGDIENGATITFYINGVQANETATFEAGGGPTQRDLSVPETPPSIITGAASSITTESATLNGNAVSLGTALLVEVSFEWGTTTAYGNEATVTSPLSEAGAFSATLTGLSQATNYHFRAKAVGHGTSYGLDMTFTTKAAPAAPAAEEALPGTTDVRGMVTAEGRFTTTVTATSEDELCTLTIPEGTVGLTADLEPLTEITMVIMDEPPLPPEDANIIGLAYDFGPDRATFDPSIILTWSYDPADIPEGIAEDTLVIAYYDETAGEWVELECVVDAENNTITALVSHFTTFAIVSSIPPSEEEEVVPPEEEEEVVPPEKEEEVTPEEEEVVAPEEEEEVAPEEEEEVIPEPAKPINWGLIGGIIGAAVLVIVLVTFFVVRRRAY